MGTTGRAWGLRISQPPHVQCHKYALLFDPVILLFGVPPKNIIAREKSYTCAAVYSNIIYKSKNWNGPKGPVSFGGDRMVCQ